MLYCLLIRADRNKLNGYSAKTKCIRHTLARLANAQNWTGVAAVDEFQMVKCQEHDPPRQTGNNYVWRIARAYFHSLLPRTEKQQGEPRQSRYSTSNQFHRDSRRSKNSWPKNSRLHRKRVHGSKYSFNAGPMASTKKEPQTSNTTMSDGQQPLPTNDGALEQNKLWLAEKFGSWDHVDDNDNPILSNLSAQPTTLSPVSNEGK